MEKKFYVIATTPRSGSNLLSDLLLVSGVMGQPSEFLNPNGTIPPLAIKHNLLDARDRLYLSQYLNFVTENFCSANGVFGLKLLFDQFEIFFDYSPVKKLLQKSKFILLSRRDFISQAVSLHIATETDSWKSFEEDKSKRKLVEYDEKKISYFVNRIFQHNLKWIEFFTVNKIDYLQIYYEELLANPNQVCQNICSFFDIETDYQFNLEKTRFQKQGDELNQKLADTFRNNSTLNLTRVAKAKEVEYHGITIV
jgi:LPS sulfotransferase NodH